MPSGPENMHLDPAARKHYLNAMKIKGIHFTAGQLAYLAKQAKRLEITVAEYIRRMIDKERGA